MRKIIALVIVLVLLTATSTFLTNTICGVTSTENTWITRTPMEQARSCLGVAAVNGKIYAIGGSAASGWAPSIPPSAAYGDINLGGIVGTNEEYNPLTDSWTYRASIPTPRMAFAIAVYDNKIYCIGGRSTAGDTAVTEVYDPQTNTWEKKASLPVAEAWLKAVTVVDTIHVLTYSGINYAYNPVSDSWSTKASVPFPASGGYVLVSIDGKIHVVAGYLHAIYDSESDTWTTAMSPPSSNSGGAAEATSGIISPKRIYLFGLPANLKQGEAQGFVRVYNPETDSWEYGAHNAMNRYNFGVASLNETFYVIGGHTYTFPGNFTPSKGVDLYIPIGHGNQPPEVKFLTLANQTYNQSTVSITFTTNKPFSWIGYSLNERENMTITGNFTINDLPNGTHTLTVYANDTLGNMGASETIVFTVIDQFPSTFAIGIIAIGIIITAALSLLLLRKHQKTMNKAN